MQDADTYIEFARECRRLADRATAEDKATLLKIAEAWEAEAKAARDKSGAPRASSGSDGGSR